ncbi:MAG TPA: ChaN family lipoprotein [Anaeromyxobacteraceae bacterium]|nr:ChaN family lipoprotein [Anaeromyxobacteraceae bacterium]
MSSPQWPKRFTALVAWVMLGAAGCRSSSGLPPFTTPLLRDHPLVGSIYEVRPARMVDAAKLFSALPKADFVLLGETHDNPDHHQLEARLVRALVAAGRRPAVAFEMIDTELQPEVDRSIRRAPRDADALAQAVGWARSGWPAFAFYRPVFLAALEAGLPVIAANLPRRQAREVVKTGLSALDPGARAILEHAGPLSPEVAASLRAEMADSHCGALPDSMLDDLVLMQRARDAELAERLLSAQADGAVLVAGAGHARRDRGVPFDLEREAPSRSSLSVAFLEVAPDLKEPADYKTAFGADALPFDFVIFTPRAERTDPCEQMRRAHPPAPAGPSLSL